MTQQTINVGAAPNDGTGDPLQTVFTKSNANFTELYAKGSAPQGRLTLQTAAPVMTTTQAAKTTLFYSPYCGNQIGLYDGANIVMTAFTELSVATTDTTKSPAAIGASKVNDWYVWSDGGTLRLGHGPDWTSDTVRSAGTALTMVNGILLNNVSITNGPAAQRGTYVGTTRSNASSQLDFIFGSRAANGGQAWLGVWNCYNRVDIRTMVQDTTTSWTYATASYGNFNGSTTWRVSFVSGLNEDTALARLVSFVSHSASGYAHIAASLDGTSVSGANPPLPAATIGSNMGSINQVLGAGQTSYSEALANVTGFHFFGAYQYTSSGTVSIFGLGYSGLTFEWRC